MEICCLKLELSNVLNPSVVWWQHAAQCSGEWKKRKLKKEHVMPNMDQQLPCSIFFFSFSSSHCSTLLPSTTWLQWWPQTITTTSMAPLQQQPRHITHHFHGPNDAFWCVFGPMVSFFKKNKFHLFIANTSHLSSTRWRDAITIHPLVKTHHPSLLWPKWCVLTCLWAYGKFF